MGCGASADSAVSAPAVAAPQRPAPVLPDIHTQRAARCLLATLRTGRVDRLPPLSSSPWSSASSSSSSSKCQRGASAKNVSFSKWAHFRGDDGTCGLIKAKVPGVVVGVGAGGGALCTVSTDANSSQQFAERSRLSPTQKQLEWLNEVRGSPATPKNTSFTSHTSTH
eukprot:m51a1_g1538 hypothetical protein (167) ;mRNA; r:539850-540350